ncbi:MAG: YibE/F family protein [Erysipelotrichaceae bacterium]|nr:YibE/F family protein [Erysipelotrichaceae bacterium]
MKKVLEILKQQKIVLVITILSVLFALIFNTYFLKEYSRVNASTTNYVSAKVVQVISEDIEYRDSLEVYVGSQEIEVEFLEGNHKGETATFTNYITAVHNIRLYQGSKIIITADEPDGVDPYYTVYSYDRGFGMFVFLAILCMAITMIGKGKGVRSILGLAYSMFAIIGILLPMVFSGYPPIPITIIIIDLSTTVSLLLLNGESIKTYSAIVSTILGVLFAAICFYLMSIILHINGFSSDESESLILINQATGLKVIDILFAGILISSLGAIMDVGMSIVSSLYEIFHHKPDITSKELFFSGIEIGKDMIGTMTNRLIFAFTGEFLYLYWFFILMT